MCALLAACSSKQEADEPDLCTDPPVDAGDSGARPPDELDAFCDKLATRNCLAMQGCCIDKGIGFDASACEAEMRAGCERAACAVRRGVSTFRDVGDECFSGAKDLFDKCEAATFDERLTWTQYVFERCMPFQGNVAAFEPCSDSFECAQPQEPNEWAYCDGHVCRVEHLLSPGQGCKLGDLCAAGHYCNAAAPGLGGTCVPDVVPGETCSSDVPCGYGAYCDAAESVCVTAVNGPGQACDSGNQCVSEACDIVTLQCVTAQPEITSVACLGAGPPSAARARSLAVGGF